MYRMAHAQLLALLPSPWPDLLAILTSINNKVDPLARAEAWWLQMTESANSPGWLCWSDFIDTLRLKQPAIKNNELIFCPVFYHAPAFLQVYILAFICRHRKEISMTLLSRLLRMVRDTDQRPELKFSQNDVYINLLSEYCIGEKTRESFSSNVKISQRLDRCVMSPLKDVITQPDDSRYSSCEASSQVNAVEEVANILPPDDLVVMAVEEEYPDAAVHDDGVLRDRAVKLKELWLAGTEEVEEDIFLTLTSPELHILFRYMDVASLPDVAMTTACQTVSRLGQRISVHSGTVFAQRCLLPAAQRLDQPASRLLINGFVTFASPFPSVLIQAVLVPLLTSPALTSFQTDIVIRVTKEAFAVQHQRELLSLICSQCSKWTDGILLVVQSVIETKIDLSSALLDVLVISMEDNAPQHSTNLKYGKLLLAVINNYGHQLSEEQRGRIYRAAEPHKTFMKKSIISLLSKLGDV